MIVPNTKVSPIYAIKDILIKQIENFIKQKDKKTVIKKIVVLDKIYQEEVNYKYFEVYNIL